MAVLVHLHELLEQPLALTGAVTAQEMDWDTRDKLIRITQPLHYEIEIEKLEQELLIRGNLHLVLDCQCGRCLKSFACPVHLEPWTACIPLAGEDKAMIVNDGVDLTPYFREDMFLAFPQHPLCGPQCDGLTELHKDVKPGGEWESNAASSVWAELNKLKF